MPSWPRQSDFDALILAESGRRGVPFAVIKAVMAAESGFDPNAFRPEPSISDASYGLMQVLAGTARGMGYTGADAGLFDPATSIEYGTRFLRAMYDESKSSYPNVVDGHWQNAVSAYNGGWRPGLGYGFPRAPGGYANQAYVSRVVGYAAGFLGVDSPYDDPALRPVGWVAGMETIATPGWGTALALVALLVALISLEGQG